MSLPFDERRSETWGRDTHQETANILEDEVEVGNALLPFGSVSSSHLLISGPLVQTTPKPSSAEACIRHDDGGEHSVKLFS